MKRWIIALGLAVFSTATWASEAGDALKDTANTVLKKAIDVAQAGGEFLKEQIPDVLQQLLAWTLARDTIVATAWFVSLVMLGYFWFKLLPAWFDEDNNAAYAALPATLATFISVVAFFSNALEAVQILVAPKVFLLEYAAHLVK